MCRQDADQRQGNRRHNHQRHDERSEPSHHEHIDEHQHGGKREPQIAKHLNRDMPFTIPLH